MIVIFLMIFCIIESLKFVLIFVGCVLFWVAYGEAFAGLGLRRGLLLRAGVVLLAVGALGFIVHWRNETAAARTNLAFIRAWQAGDSQAMASQCDRRIELNRYISDRIRLDSFDDGKQVGKEALVFPKWHGTLYLKGDAKLFETNVRLTRLGETVGTKVKVWIVRDSEMGTEGVVKIEIEDDWLASFVREGA